MTVVSTLIRPLTRSLVTDLIPVSEAPAPYSVTLTGLTDGEARPGDHASIGFTTDPSGGTITQRWGLTLGGDDLGTDADPDDFTEGDGGTLYLQVTRDGVVVNASAPIREADPEITATDSLDGRDLTITVTENAGGDADYELTALTLDGEDVLGDETGTGPWTYAVPSSAAGQVVAWEVTATNSGGEDIVSGAEAVAADLTAPEVVASDDLDGRTLTITVDSNTGNPSPTASLTTLTLDGDDVLEDTTGTGPWVYVVPDSAASQTVTWEVTSTNVVDSDTASGSEDVAANLSAPAATAAPTFTGSVQEGETVTINEGNYTGAPSPTITGVLTLGGVDVTGDMDGDEYTIPTDAGGDDLVWTETASNGVSPNAQQSVSETVVADTAPAQMAAPTVTATSATEISVDLATAPDDGGSEITGYDLRWSTNQADWTTLLDIADPQTIDELTAETEYFVQTRAVNAVGPGPWSASGSDTTDAVAATLTITNFSYSRNADGVAPTITANAAATGTTTADYTWHVVFAATEQTKPEIDASPNKFTVVKDTLLFSAESMDIDNSVIGGKVSAYMQDSSEPAIVSNVVSDDADYDAVAPAFSSFVISNEDPDAAVLTVSKNSYVAQGETLEIGDLTFGGDLAGNVDGITRTSALTYRVDLDTDAEPGDTLTVALAPGTLVGIDAEDVSFAAQSVTNNVSSSALLDDDFTSDTSGDWTVNPSATLTYDAVNDCLLVEPSGAFQGVSSPAITVTNGASYLITVNVTNLDPEGVPATQIDCQYGRSGSLEAFGSCPAGQRVADNTTADIVHTVTISSGTELIVTPRCRAQADFRVNSILVEEVV
ncbi:fibronectin type III domain-containing protein [Roseovarius sp.]|uniref:fibronectin type III domain-containing protein n=1 Tax=Roseovarius sp. TaxID=1486281 RepID=UPI003D105ED7